MNFYAAGKISRIIFSFFSLLLFSSALYAGISLPGKITIEEEYSNGADTAFIRAALKEIRGLCRRAGIKRSRDGLLLRTGRKDFRFIKKKNRYLCELPGKAADWQRSFHLRRQLYGVLFCVNAGITAGAADFQGIPVWMTAALDEAVEQDSTAEKYFSGNRNWYLAETLLRQCGTLPDFTALMYIEKEPSDPLLKLYFRQFSRLLMELFVKRRMLKRFIEEYNTTAGADCWISWFSSPAEANNVLTAEAEKLLWNSFSPAPPEKLMEQLGELETTIVPEIDENGAPSGQMREMNYREVAQLLTSKRPDADILRNSFVKKCHSFGLQGNFALRSRCGALAAIASKFGKESSAPDDYAAKLQLLKEFLTKEKERELFISRTQLEKKPVSDNIKWLLQLYRTPAWTETTAVKEKLDKFSN